MGKVRKLGGLHAVIADNVRRLRKARGLSQEVLAGEEQKGIAIAAALC